jgi:hypothetical protein
MSPSRRAAFAATLAVSVSPYGLMAQAQTKSPIEHVIVIVGENHTFDNVFGRYVPRPGQTVLNLLSQDIIDEEGKPGRNFTLAKQRTANSQGAYGLNPTRIGAALMCRSTAPPSATSRICSTSKISGPIRRRSLRSSALRTTTEDLTEGADQQPPLLPSFGGYESEPSVKKIQRLGQIGRDA